MKICEEEKGQKQAEVAEVNKMLKSSDVKAVGLASPSSSPAYTRTYPYFQTHKASAN